MVSQMVSDLYFPLSKERLEAYRPAGSGDLDMLTNYFWNIDLAEALVPSLHAVELAVRNSIHAVMTGHHGTDMWFYKQGALQPAQLGEFARALGKVAKNPRPGRIVAELNFGFWVTLLSGPYEQPLWQPGGYALLKAAFPHASASRKQIHERFNAIRELRNRVFHYEAIWNRPNLLGEHADIHEAIRWISPTLHSAVHAVDNFPKNFVGKAQVEADLKRRLVRRSSSTVQMRIGITGHNSSMVSSTYAPSYVDRTSGMAHYGTLWTWADEARTGGEGRFLVA